MICCQIKLLSHFLSLSINHHTPKKQERSQQIGEYIVILRRTSVRKGILIWEWIISGQIFESEANSFAETVSRRFSLLTSFSCHKPLLEITLKRIRSKVLKSSDFDSRKIYFFVVEWESKLKLKIGKIKKCREGGGDFQKWKNEWRGGEECKYFLVGLRKLLSLSNSVDEPDAAASIENGTRWSYHPPESKTYVPLLREPVGAGALSAYKRGWWRHIG